MRRYLIKISTEFRSLAFGQHQALGIEAFDFIYMPALPHSPHLMHSVALIHSNWKS